MLVATCCWSSHVCVFHSDQYLLINVIILFLQNNLDQSEDSFNVTPAEYEYQFDDGSWSPLPLPFPLNLHQLQGLSQIVLTVL